MQKTTTKDVFSLKIKIGLRITLGLSYAAVTSGCTIAQLGILPNQPSRAMASSCMRLGGNLTIVMQQL